MLDVLVAKVGLQCTGVVPLVRQRIAAGVPEHVRVSCLIREQLDKSVLSH
jgi:hypothetical protein